MNLAKLFGAQKLLANRIMEEHPELKRQDNLPWKILAFQVEVSELANEWRGFKMWSHDRKPRKSTLEEYADGIAFLLEIGLELGFEKEIEEIKPFKLSDIIKQFIFIHKEISEVFNLREFIVPYVDVFELYLGLGEMLGFTWEEIEAAYFEKNKINHERQDTGY